LHACRSTLEDPTVFVGYLTREYFEGAILKTADIKQ